MEVKEAAGAIEVDWPRPGHIENRCRRLVWVGIEKMRRLGVG